MISAFNALTLSPALSAMLLKPRQKATGLLSRFFAGFNRGFEAKPRAATSVSATASCARRSWASRCSPHSRRRRRHWRRLPTSFVPEEDYGYFLINLQLPPAASLERTDAVTRKIDQLLAHTEGIAAFNTIAGFSLLSRVTADKLRLLLHRLKPWDERTRADLGAKHIVDRLNAGLRRIVPEATAFAMMPPSIPGLGSQGGFSFWLQDRTGGSVELLSQNVQTFLDAARKRPELAGLASQFTASVPQLFADVDRDKVLKQGVALGDVYQTMQTFLGGLFVNQFSRFGRQWRVFLQAGRRGSHESNGNRAVLRPQQRRRDGAVSALETTKPAFGPQYTNRFNVYRGALVTGAAAPRLQLRAGARRARGHRAPGAAARDRLRLVGPVVPGKERQRIRPGCSRCRSRRFPDSRGAVRKLVAAVLRIVVCAIAVFGAVVGLVIRRYDFDVFAQIGIIMLIGLAAKNAILNRRVRQGEARRRHEPRRRSAGRRETEAASDPDDLFCVHPRMCPAMGRDRLGRRSRRILVLSSSAACWRQRRSRSSSSRCCSCSPSAWPADSRGRPTPAARPQRRSKGKPDMRALILLLVAGAAAACTVGPDYKAADCHVPDAYAARRHPNLPWPTARSTAIRPGGMCSRTTSCGN